MVGIARDAIEGKRWRCGTKKYRAVVALDVRSAFNSANWRWIMRALFNMATTPYFMESLNNYFQNRRVNYLTGSGQARLQNKIRKVFLRRLPLSRFLAKTLRVNKNCHEKFLKKSVVRN